MGIKNCAFVLIRKRQVPEMTMIYQSPNNYSDYLLDCVYRLATRKTNKLKQKVGEYELA